MANEQLPSITWAEPKAACLERSTANALWMDSLEAEMVNADPRTSRSARPRRCSRPPATASSTGRPGQARRPLRLRPRVRPDLHRDPAAPVRRRGEDLPAARRARAGVAVPLRLPGAAGSRRGQVRRRPVGQGVRDQLQAAPLRHRPHRVGGGGAGRPRRPRLHRGLRGRGGARRPRDSSRDWKRRRTRSCRSCPTRTSPLTPEARAKARKAITAFLAAMENENRSFVLAALDAYREEVAV